MLEFVDFLWWIVILVKLANLVSKNNVSRENLMKPLNLQNNVFLLCSVVFFSYELRLWWKLITLKYKLQSNRNSNIMKKFPNQFYIIFQYIFIYKH